MAPLKSLLRSTSSVERRLLSGIIVVAALVLGFAFLASQVIDGGTKAFDERILQFFRAQTNASSAAARPWLRDVMRDITVLGSTIVLTIVVVVVVGVVCVLC